MTKRLVATLVAATAVAWATPALAAVDHYVVQVDGLACPFCAYGLEKKLKALPGASKVHIDLDAGRASFDVSGAVLMPDPVRDAVRDAGFTPRGFVLTAGGTVGGEGDALQLDIGGGQKFRLRGGDALDRLREWLRDKHRNVVITGTATEAGGAWQLQVDQVRLRPGS